MEKTKKKPLPIGTEQVRSARQILEKYRSAKQGLTEQILENYRWYKMRHWECMESKPNAIQPVSGWLFNAIANKHADAMDNFPSPNILPREAGDKEQARMLTAVLPVILDYSDFEEVYHKVWDSKLIGGTGIYGVFWDKEKLGGLGDIAVTKVDLLSLYFQPGISDIQQSAHVFHVTLADNDALLSAYPQLEGNLTGCDSFGCFYDDTVDTSEKSMVVDWYYKKGKTLHYCKFVGEQVLYASENDPACREGFYAHGQYPFVFDPLFRVEGSPCGFGYIDVGKSAQEYIDRGNQAVLQNLLVNARPRYFIRSDGAVNEGEFADLSRDFIHVDGNLGQDSVLPVGTKPLDGIYVSVLEGKIQELKEVTGNRDVSTGGTSSGVTAASAIAAMQEAGSKLSRDGNRASYRVFRKICLLIIELIRQFYDLPRCFRITGMDGQEDYVNFSNHNIAPVYQGVELGMDMGYRTPIFDVEVTAQKQSPYSKLSQNELAIQFFSAGFFNPAMAQQALMCLDMMDFDRKHMVMQAIRDNAGGLSAPLAGTIALPKTVENPNAHTPAMERARQRVAESTAP